MSHLAIQTYRRELESLKKAGGVINEGSLRRAFENLLQDYCRTKDLVLVPELSLSVRTGKKKRPDGTVKDPYGIFDWGYWESKDTKDSLEEEIKNKFAIGYPKTNIIFEDTEQIVLFQGDERTQASMRDAAALDKILRTFVAYERPEIQDFRKAVEVFREDVGKLVPYFRDLIEKQNATNEKFRQARDKFLEICRAAINPAVSPEDVREMLVQHILTEELFTSIFDNPDFHRENAIARELEDVLRTFFFGKEKQDFLHNIRYYYQTIRAAVSNIPALSEKQRVLKVVYEEFYKAYNPKGADKLGIVYTPNEVVRFMIQATDALLDKHFNKTLADEGVHILDPAVGTGTFVCDLLEHIPSHYRGFKYKNEIHCNEVSILPYYIANLNIEFVYQWLSKEYQPYENICFLDTLDNTDPLGYQGRNAGLFGVTAENARRVKNQNAQKISVIIGNPPYNANQQNENDNNKNRTYEEVDKRIKETYIKKSSAQKTKVYDMYARFFRWATDRIGDKGLIAFVTNRSFIDSRTFDGFRKCLAEDFDYIYIVDTKSDVRANPKIAGTTHNVFGIQTGVAIMFLVKTGKKEKFL